MIMDAHSSCAFYRIFIVTTRVSFFFGAVYGYSLCTHTLSGTWINNNNNIIVLRDSP